MKIRIDLKKRRCINAQAHCFYGCDFSLWDRFLSCSRRRRVNHHHHLLSEPVWGVSGLRVEDGDIVIVPDAFGGTARRTTDNNTIITGVGVTSDFALSVQDGNGRVQYYWNVDPSALTYLVNNEEAGVFNFHPPGASTFGSSSTSWVTFVHAPAGTAGTAISWTLHLEIQTDGDVIVPTGNVGIGTTNPGTKLAVTGLTSGGGNTLRIVPGTGNIYYEASSKNIRIIFNLLKMISIKFLRQPLNLLYTKLPEKKILVT